MEEYEKNFNCIREVLEYNVKKTILAAKTGHAGACMSMMEQMIVLYFSECFDLKTGRDKLLCRGHLGPLRYNIFALLGWVDGEQLINGGYRKFGTPFHGHEDMYKTPGIDCTPSGSLGMLLSYAAGMRLAGDEGKIVVSLGDGEETEGNVAEAARNIIALNLLDIVVLIDCNKKSLSTSVAEYDTVDLAKLWNAYGYETFQVQNGHDFFELYSTLKAVSLISKPTCVIIKTIKGHTILGCEKHQTGFHVYHKTPSDSRLSDDVDFQIKQPSPEALAFVRDLKLPPRRYAKIENAIEYFNNVRLVDETCLPKVNNLYTTFYNFLLKYAQSRERRIIVLTPDYPPRDVVAGGFFKNEPNINYINVGLREQHCIAMIRGIRATDKNSLVVVLMGDAFLYRMADQMYVLNQINEQNCIFLSVEGGISAAKNGSSHQSTSQPGFAASLNNFDAYEPCVNSDLIAIMQRHTCLVSKSCYIRIHKLHTFADFFDISKNLKLYAATFGARCDIEGCISSPPRVLITCGIFASKILLPEFIKKFQRVYFICNLASSLPDLAQDLKQESFENIFLYYNGSVQILADLVRRMVSPEFKLENGFTNGLTGDSLDLFRHFFKEPS
jgi:transketolase